MAWLLAYEPDFRYLHIGTLRVESVNVVSFRSTANRPAALHNFATSDELINRSDHLPSMLSTVFNTPFGSLGRTFDITDGRPLQSGLNVIRGSRA